MQLYFSPSPVIIGSRDVAVGTHCTEKDGDWYIYPLFLANKNRKNAQKRKEKSQKHQT